MNKFFIKKVVGCILTAAVTLTSIACPPAYAENNDYDNEILQFGSLEEYIDYSIPRHLYAQSILIDGTLSYSNPVALYNFSDNSIIGSEIFIFDDDRIIGKTEVYNGESGYISMFDTYIPDDLLSAYCDGQQIAMGYFEEDLLMYTVSDGFVHIDGLESCDLAKSALPVPQELSAITIWGITSPDFAIPYSISRISLDVKHVHNSTKEDKYGQCWAACLAMKLNYQKGLNLDADTVTAVCKSDVSLQEKGGSVGANPVSPDITAMYNYYGYAVTTVNDAISHGDVYYALADGKPLVISIHNTDTDDYGHAMVIKGIILDGSSSTYMLDDPNKWNTTVTWQLNGNPTQKDPNISYDDSGYTYNHWRRTYY